MLTPMPSFRVKLSPVDRDAAVGKRAGDVCTNDGDLLAFTRDYGIPRGKVFIRQDQVPQAEKFGWTVDATSAPHLNDELVTVSR